MFCLCMSLCLCVALWCRPRDAIVRVGVGPRVALPLDMRTPSGHGKVEPFYGRRLFLRKFPRSRLIWPRKSQASTLRKECGGWTPRRLQSTRPDRDRARFGRRRPPNLAVSGPMSVKPGRFRTKFGGSRAQFGPNSVHILLTSVSNLADAGPNVADFGHILSDLAEVGTSSAEVSTNLADLGCQTWQIPEDIGQIDLTCSNSGQLWSTSGHTWSIPGRFRRILGNVWGRIWPG